MKLISNLTPSHHSLELGEIPIGSCFALSDGLYIKSNFNCQEDAKCVNLNNGKLITMSLKYLVLPVFAEVHHEPVNFSEL